MSELEKQVLKAIEEAAPLLAENEQNRLLGFGEGVTLNPAIIKEVLKQKTPEDKKPASATA